VSNEMRKWLDRGINKIYFVVPYWHLPGMTDKNPNIPQSR